MNSKKTMIWLSSWCILFHVLVVFLTSTTVSASFISENETDFQALLQIKSMITPGALATWNNSFHFCDWIGITCGKRHRRVTRLVVNSHGLEGSLSPHVGNLTFLRNLSLSNNSLQGAIPHELGRLSRLRFLSLSKNMLQGVIPANISGCSNLEEISLSHNELVGDIPREISFLSKLAIVHLGDNKLTGGIPPFWGNITSMKVFSFTRNPLGGSIPDTIGKLKFLRELHCATCNLYGMIPHSIYNLSLMKNVSLSENHLYGSLPLAIGAMFPRLAYFRLWRNQLTGPVPPSISNCSSLVYLDLGDNKFSGKLTINFAKLRDIHFLRLGNNTFGSKKDDELKFIDSMQNCTKLTVLQLQNCKFQGMLPISIGNLSNKLHYLDLYGNQLHGNLPTSIGNLVGLDRLQLHENQFTGSIPSTIGKLQKLEVIYLHKNKLSGTIPDVMGNLSLLGILSLSSNKLEGVIPSNLGNCHGLSELLLNDNKLNGKIPTQLLQLSSLSIFLDLSRNNLFGSLPPEVGGLNTLCELDLSHNNLSGNIPSSLSGCTSLVRLSLEGNNFQGMLPPSLISLKGLEELDISHNNFNGKIPQFLEGFSLKYLNLSYNDFEGEVPTSGLFANEGAFSILGNGRLCGGIVGLGLPKCKDPRNTKIKWYVYVIAVLIASTLFIISCLAYSCCKKKRKNQHFESSRSEQFIRVSYSQLLKATNGFSKANLIGSGGFSSVYKGILNEDDRRFVAVKVLHPQNHGAQRSFMRECEAWRNIRHRNLLKIISSCSGVDFQGNDFNALVYEFMPNGSLYDWLHSSGCKSRLNLLQIVNILMDIAFALDYIHNQCLSIIVHGDLKPSNVLLDDDMVAHVGDFGSARFLGTSYANSSTGIRGTIGYAAPEYGLGSEMTRSGDVYSFGILVLEVMTRKQPTDDIFNEGLSLHKFASMALADNVFNIVDANILNVYKEDDITIHNTKANTNKIEECVASIVEIGVSCSVDSPEKRIDIKKVVHELQLILDTLQNN